VSTFQEIIVVGGALAAIAAGIGDLVIPWVLAGRVEGYSQLRQPVSDLGAVGSPVAPWINGWWIVFGLLMLWFAAAVAWVLRDRGPAAWVLAGQIAFLGLFAGIGAGVFSLDPEAGSASISTRLHNLSGALGFLPVCLAPLVGIWLFPPGTSPLFSGLCMATQVTALGIGLLHAGLGQGLLPGHLAGAAGLWQRLLLADLYIFTTALAVKILSLRPSPA
jgi:hypothetical membrane protein